MTHSDDIIEFDALVRAYDDFLAGSARGIDFGIEFLGIWAPSEDRVQSVVNVLIAALDWGESTVRVRLGKSGFDDAARAAILERATEFGAVSVEETAERLDIRVSGLHAPGEQAQRIAPVYRKAVEAAARAPAHERPTADSLAHLARSATLEGTTLALVMDEQTLIVGEALYAGTTDTVSRGIMERFCAAIEGTPLQDAAEYGVIRTAAAMSEPGAAPPAAGIVSAPGVEPAFDRPRRLIRAIYTAVLADTERAPEHNHHQPAPAETWRKLSDAKRLETLRDALNSHLIALGLDAAALQVVAIDGPKRVVCRFADSVPPGERGRVLMAAEKSMRVSVERTIELFLNTTEDANEIRNLKAS